MSCLGSSVRSDDRGADQGRSPRPVRQLPQGNLVGSARRQLPDGPKEQRPWGSNGRPSSTAAEHRSKMVSVICLNTPYLICAKHQFTNPHMSGHFETTVMATTRKEEQGCQAAPTSRRRPRSFTEARRQLAAGKPRWFSPAASCCRAERTTALGKQREAKFNRGGTPQQDGLGNLPEHPP